MTTASVDMRLRGLCGVRDGLHRLGSLRPLPELATLYAQLEEFCELGRSKPLEIFSYMKDYYADFEPEKVLETYRTQLVLLGPLADQVVALLYGFKYLVSLEVPTRA